MNSDKFKLEVSGTSQLFPKATVLIEALAQMGYFLPAACGGRGACGSCRVTVKSPEITHNHKEKPYLSAAERHSGVHLACQCQIDQDTRIELSRESLQAGAYDGRLYSMEQISESFRRITIVFSGQTRPVFKPGQFALVEFPDPLNPGVKLRRALSVAGNCQDLDRIVFLVALLPGGKLSEYCRIQASLGDALKIIGPFGDFGSFMSTRPECWLAVGSGIAPFLSMLHSHLQVPQASRSPLKFVFSSKHQNDLDCLSKLPEILALGADFKAIRHLEISLPEYLLKHLREESQLGLSSNYLLCAGPGIIDSCINILLGQGIPREQIKFDRFY